jgi:hypothetical protein
VVLCRFFPKIFEDHESVFETKFSNKRNVDSRDKNSVYRHLVIVKLHVIICIRLIAVKLFTGQSVYNIIQIQIQIVVFIALALRHITL